MNSGTAWKTAAEPTGARPGNPHGTAPFVKHPTAAWPPALGSPNHGAFEVPPKSEADSGTFRRVARPVRQTPTVPWFMLISCISVLCVLILLVVTQRAQLIKEQYELIKYKEQRSTVLKERSELKLSIQRLTSLDRIDNISRRFIKMVSPPHRILLDLAEYRSGMPHPYHVESVQPNRKEKKR